MSQKAAIEGIVTKDPSGEPVKKVLVELIAENQKQGGDYTGTTGPDGAFRIENILPGRYRLFAERTGFLDIDKHHGRSEGRVFTLRPGEDVKGLQIRLQAAAVLRGRVTDEDGDPLAGAEVSALRQTFVTGHKHWEQVGSERTNDLGEYRIANLPPGTVFISVNPPPDFKSLIESAGARGDGKSAGAGDNGQATAYQTTYYPGTPDRSQAMPIQLHAGDEFPANFSLTPGPSLSIRGQVVNLPPRTSATIMLQSRDFRLVTSGTEMHKDGSFVIRDVSPGSYLLLASVEGSSVPMIARQTLEVGSSNVDGLRLSPQPGATVRGRLRVESSGKGFDPDQVYLVLQPVDGQDDEAAIPGASFSNLAHVTAGGEFVWTDVPPGNYYVQILGNGSGANEGWFLKTVLSGTRDVGESGIAVSGGTVFLDLVASANGAVVEGVAGDSKGQPVANAVVVAVPESRMRGHMDQYRQTVSDQNGHFSLRGIRGGTYTLFAWESVDGQAYYNPEFLKSCEGQGQALQLSETDRKTVQLTVIPAGDEE
ncbi:MAG: carboxypeptidase regulatory-like domain-containing protein [Acidobacteriota bacterium]